MSKRHQSPQDEPPAHRPLSALQALRDRLPTGPELEPMVDPLKSAEDEEFPRLVVRRERKGMGGKTATRVQGLQLNESERTKLAKQLKRALGSGARWDADELLVQGDLLERVAVWFEARGHRVVRGN